MTGPSLERVVALLSPSSAPGRVCEIPNGRFVETKSENLWLDVRLLWSNPDGGFGSLAGLRRRELGAVDLPFNLGEHEADVGVYLAPAISSDPIGKSSSHQRPLPKCSRHTQTAVPRCSFSKAVAHNSSALVGVR